MGFMDHLLATLSPERAVKTAAARMAIQTLNSGYGNYGANLHKKSMRGWMWHGGDSKRDIEDNLRVLRERSRDAYMGVPLATGAIKTMRTNVICGGLTPTPQIDNEFLGISDEEAQKVNAQIMREFSLWADKPTCDADRIDNFYMLQQLAFTGFLMNGDALAVLQNKRTPNVPYDLRVRIVEADRLCSPAFTDIDSPREIDGRLVQRITQGVETDADGMVVAYWICDRHPLASATTATLTADHCQFHAGFVRRVYLCFWRQHFAQRNFAGLILFGDKHREHGGNDRRIDFRVRVPSQLLERFQHRSQNGHAA